MSVSRRDLLTEARNIRATLIDLPEYEIHEAVLEILKCYDPFHNSKYLEDVIFESGQTGDRPEPVSDSDQSHF